ncbi:hypothetical protein HU200_040553 [Digitaria exilis]|uniref:Uncharacterized protein n=1 Tax=Digitaria exilis TaxID=1010633 RepID=A0A835EEN0_9POAL|nr:hypothetical protein HU200_040553 [Digitaria exilis]
MNTSPARYNSYSTASSGTVSTAYTSTTGSSPLTSTTVLDLSAYMSSGSVEQQAIHGLTARLVIEHKRSDVLPEVNTEKEKQFDGLVQEFFGANCSTNGGATSVLERWFRELRIPWVLRLADGAAAGELERSFRSQIRHNAVCSWIRALAEIMDTSHSARSLFPDRSSQLTRFTQETVSKMLPFVDVIVASTDEAFHSEWVDAPYKKIKTLLDVRDALSKALSKIGLPYRSSQSAEVVETIQGEGEMVTLLSAKQAKLDQAIWNTMEEIRRGILEPMDRSNDSSGAHTPSVTDHLQRHPVRD